MVGITSYGGYIPRYRLNRKLVVQSMSWFNPGIMGLSKGEKAVANWDEDAVSMAVEAARDCMAGKDAKVLDGIYLASTTLPFANRLNAGIVSAALNAQEDKVMTADFSSCLRAGVTASIAAVEAVASGKKNSVLVVASDQRRTKMGTPFEMFFGDGAAALLFGKDNVIAELKGSHSVSCDFIDHYRGYGKEFNYNWEERWVRDEGYGKIIPQAIAGFLKKTGMAIGDFSKVIYPCYFAATHAAIAKKLGIDPSKVQGNMHEVCGDTGTAHPLVMFVAALQEAKPGDKLLLASFGQGCDVLAFEVTDKIKDVKGPKGINGTLARRAELTSYLKYTQFRNLIPVDMGIRGETNPNSALTAAWRHRKLALGFTGGKCKKCGTPQFPLPSICVNPDCGAVNEFEPYVFSGKGATILLYTADMLAASVDPPAVYGMVGFDGGGRYPMDFTDCDAKQLKVGLKGTLSFRRRLNDMPARGYSGYFWKFVPTTEGGE